MKPFDLELAKKGHKVVTREGLEYKFGVHNSEMHRDRSVLGWIKLPHNSWMDVSHDEKGNYCGTINDNPRDLFMAEPEYWVNIYEDSGRISDMPVSVVGEKIFTKYSDAVSAGLRSVVMGPYYKYIETVKITPTNTLK